MTYDWGEETRKYKRALVLRFLSRVLFLVVALLPIYLIPILSKPEFVFDSSGAILKILRFLASTKIIIGFFGLGILIYLSYFVTQLI